MVNEKLGERIALARKTAGYTQKEFAAMLKIDKATLNRYEKDHRVPDANLIANVLIQCGCDAEWLILGREPTYSKTNEMVKRCSHLEGFSPEERKSLEQIHTIFDGKDEKTINTLTSLINRFLGTLNNDHSNIETKASAPDELICTGQLLKILRGRNQANVTAIKTNLHAFALTADINVQDDDNCDKQVHYYTPDEKPHEARETESVEAAEDEAPYSKKNNHN